MRRTIAIESVLRLRRFSKDNIVRFAVASLALAAHGLGAQQAAPASGARLADSVLADLSRLSDLERAYQAVNGRYADDIAELNFKPATGAVIAISYASARMFSASASHVRLSPFICFAIVSADTVSHPDKPFCTDSRYGSAAAALAGLLPARVDSVPSPDTAKRQPVAAHAAARKPAKRKATPSVESPVVISPRDFALRLRAAARGAVDSSQVVVQFAVSDARYDPEREVLEVAVDRVPLPVSPADSTHPAVACFTQPAFACGASGLAYVARGLWRVPRARVPAANVLSGGLTLLARFELGRRVGASAPAVTLLALVLQAGKETVAHWERVAAP